MNNGMKLLLVILAIFVAIWIHHIYQNQYGCSCCQGVMCQRCRCRRAQEPYGPWIVQKGIDGAVISGGTIMDGAVYDE